MTASSKPPFAGERVPFSKAFAEVSKGVSRIKQRDYLPAGDYPVVDQGQELFAGYSNRDDGLFSDVPVIVFGDHTRHVKYVDRPFFVGADGVKILKPRLSNNVRYWYHALRNTHLENLGYSRHFKLLKQATFCVPDEEAQRMVCDELDGIFELIKLARRQLSLLDELVKSRFVEMFGDPCDPLTRYPKAKIGELARVSSGATPSRKHPEYYEGTIPWVKTGEVASGNIIETEEHITEEALQETSCRILGVGTVLVAMYGQGDTRGRAALLTIEAATNQACAALEFGNQIDSQFALAYLQHSYQDLRELSYGGNQKNLSLRVLKEYPMMVPPLSLQREFAAFAAEVAKSQFFSRAVRDGLSCYAREVSLTAERGRCSRFSTNRLK